ncbi:hypothetical protein GCM10010102_38460 [Promicromonospora citrea]|uniref:Uncharacterized protein n=1 Tax=Promicromonospora citrea TaxID=43677 RepID=A0A8H9GPY5_9MICO|nr:hypothetical protein GCM10010102_38460 [Promicromonospora citrea]
MREPYDFLDSRNIGASPYSDHTVSTQAPRDVTAARRDRARLPAHATRPAAVDMDDDGPYRRRGAAVRNPR